MSQTVANTPCAPSACQLYSKQTVHCIPRLDISSALILGTLEYYLDSIGAMHARPSALISGEEQNKCSGHIQVGTRQTITY